MSAEGRRKSIFEAVPLLIAWVEKTVAYGRGSGRGSGPLCEWARQPDGAFGWLGQLSTAPAGCDSRR